jgi:hypothetical protein
VRVTPPNEAALDVSSCVTNTDVDAFFRAKLHTNIKYSIAILLGYNRIPVYLSSSIKIDLRFCQKDRAIDVS